MDSAIIEFQSRAVIADDEAFLFRLYAATREDLDAVGLPQEQKAVLLKLQFNAQRQQYAFAFPEADHSILMIEGQPVGRTLINRQPGNYCLVDITLLPLFRGRGLGTVVINDLLGNAASEHAIVTLHVRKKTSNSRIPIKAAPALIEVFKTSCYGRRKRRCKNSFIFLE
ncbi:MAG: GNAT family N-acetyltransferase [Pyrinomonadaceae bacterium]